MTGRGWRHGASPMIAMPPRAWTVQRQSIGMRPYRRGPATVQMPPIGTRPCPRIPATVRMPAIGIRPDRRGPATVQMTAIATVCTEVGSVPKRPPTTLATALTHGPMTGRGWRHGASPMTAMPPRARTVQRQSIGMRPYRWIATVQMPAIGIRPDRRIIATVRVPAIAMRPDRRGPATVQMTAIATVCVPR